MFIKGKLQRNLQNLKTIKLKFQQNLQSQQKYDKTFSKNHKYYLYFLTYRKNCNNY